MQSAQLETGVAIVIENRPVPLLLRVTLLAVLAETIFVNVFYRVASGTLPRRILVVSVDMAGTTAHHRVRIFQFETGFVMFEPGFTPAARRVTLDALFPEPAGVRIVPGVTAMTGPRGFAILLSRLVAGGTFSRGMLSAQRIVGQAMIEGIAVERDDVRPAPEVITVTGFTTLASGIRVLSVIAPLVGYISCYQFMTVQAQFLLCGCTQAHVALGALEFELCMAGNYFPRHQEFFDFKSLRACTGGNDVKQDHGDQRSHQ
jgi:hypothetical protein